MAFAGINHLAVILAAVSGWLVGAGWYTLLARPWMIALGKTKSELMDPSRASSPVPFLVAFAAQFVMAWVLAGIIGHVGPVSDRTARDLEPARLARFRRYDAADNCLARQRVMLTAIESGQWLFALLAQGIVIGLFGCADKADRDGRQAIPSAWINAKLTQASASSDRTTAPVTRPPARATTRTSTPSPNPAIAITVRMLASHASGATARLRHQADGPQRHQEQEADDEPQHELTEARPFAAGMLAHKGEHEHDRPEHQNSDQLDQRADRTSRPMRGVGVLPEAYAVSPAKTPYCVGDNPRTGASSGSASTTKTPSTAVKAIEAATSSLVAPITGAVAAIADCRRSSCRRRPGRPSGAEARASVRGRS